MSNTTIMCKKGFLFSILLTLGLTAHSQKNNFRNIPGQVVAYMDADSAQYIGSPGICILPNGNYIATHDLFGKKSTEFIRAVSRVYLSENKGKSWKQIAVLDGQFWSKPFVHKGALYIIGTDKHHGNTIIKKSTDGGYSWTSPTDNSSGLLLEGEFHCAPMPIVSHNGYLWRAMERADGEIKKWGKRYGTFMMSIKEDAELLDAANWRHSNSLPYDSTMLNGGFGAWIEGNAVVTPDKKIVNILRVHNPNDWQVEKAAIVNISDDGLQAKFDEATGFIDFPGGGKKFTIRYDEESKRYFSIVNFVPKEFRGIAQLDRVRNTQALASSADLRNWTVHKILLQHPDIKNHGFNYVDWDFEGKKNIVFLSRTAYSFNGKDAKNYHDANFLTFHKINNFRKYLNDKIE